MMTPEYAVHFWWDNTSAIKANTAATVEVDVMPQLGRTPEGGPFAGYEAALSNLGANFVRFAPWYAYPKVVVAELEPTTCGKNGYFSWNTSLLDAVVSDFMIAVCGPKASEGECEGGLSVVPQLSTMPAWMYEDDGVNRTELIPEDPWQFPSHHFDYYLVKGQPLRDASCRPPRVATHPLKPPPPPLVRYGAARCSASARWTRRAGGRRALRYCARASA